MKNLFLISLLFFSFIFLIQCELHRKQSMEYYRNHPPKSYQLSQVQNFTQYVDHYDPLNSKTYQQRYLFEIKTKFTYINLFVIHRYRVIQPTTTSSVQNVFIYLAGI